MTFQPGQSGNPKGRPAGLLASRTLQLREKARKMGCDPLEVLIKAIRDVLQEAKKTTDPERIIALRSEAVETATKLAPYLHPRLQAVTLEVDGQIEQRQASVHLHVLAQKADLGLMGYSDEQLAAIQDFIGRAEALARGNGPLIEHVSRETSRETDEGIRQADEGLEFSANVSRETDERSRDRVRPTSESFRQTDEPSRETDERFRQTDERVRQHAAAVGSHGVMGSPDPRTVQSDAECSDPSHRDSSCITPSQSAATCSEVTHSESDCGGLQHNDVVCNTVSHPDSPAGKLRDSITAARQAPRSAAMRLCRDCGAIMPLRAPGTSGRPPVRCEACRGR